MRKQMIPGLNNKSRHVEDYSVNAPCPITSIHVYMYIHCIQYFTSSTLQSITMQVPFGILTQVSNTTLSEYRSGRVRSCDVRFSCTSLRKSVASESRSQWKRSITGNRMQLNVLHSSNSSNKRGRLEEQVTSVTLQTKFIYHQFSCTHTMLQMDDHSTDHSTDHSDIYFSCIMMFLTIDDSYAISKKQYLFITPLTSNYHSLLYRYTVTPLHRYTVTPLHRFSA